MKQPEASDHAASRSEHPDSEEFRSAGSVVEQVYREFPRYLGFSRASLMLFDEESQALVSDDLIGIHRSGGASPSAPQPLGFSISGKCFIEQRPIVIDDCSKSDLVPPRFVDSLSLKSVVAIPLVARGKPIGVLRVDDTEQTHRFSEQDVEFFSMLGDMLADVVTNPRLYHELREAEHAIRESERNFRAVAENANDGILIAVGDGEVVYANVRTTEITGISSDDISKRNLRDLVSEKQRDAVMVRFQQILKGELKSTKHHETLFARPDGRGVPIELSVTQTEWKGESAVMVIVRDITERRRLEMQVLEISEDEQRRFGRDLHDGLGQTLAAIAVQCKVLERRLEAASREESQDAARITGLVQRAAGEAHYLAIGLSPVDLESRGLVVALEELASNTERAFDIPCRFDCDKQIVVTDPAVATQLYRIAQEAIGNALRHGQPSCIDLSLVRRDGKITLTIEDDGSGFSADTEASRGMGLQIMGHRARMIDSELSVSSRRGDGVKVTCVIRPGVNSGT